MSNSPEEKIRNLVNSSTIILERTISDNKKWNSLCSAMDVLGDTKIGISEFQESENIGYISLYGLLQALFLQQDAVKFIAECLGTKVTDYSELRKIRDIRNDAIGHPMNRKKSTSFHYINRGSISKQGFSLMSHNGKIGKDIFHDFDLQEILIAQRKCVEKQLGEIYKYMKQVENEHRDKYSNVRLSQILSGTGYLFEKIYSSLTNKDYTVLAGHHIELLENKVKNFSIALGDRDELSRGSIIEHTITKYIYASSKLKLIIEQEDDVIGNNLDAEIYCEFMQLKLSELKLVATDLDEKYQLKI